MNIAELLTRRATLSLEIFPPKRAENTDSVLQAADALADLNPDFMSVTYGAGGGARDATTAIARHLQRELGVTALAHFTCVGSTRASVREMLDTLEGDGVSNILALRGDVPNDGAEYPTEYRYASDLTLDIQRRGGFCIGGACYPEGHPETGSREKDIDNLARKVEAGCDFLITQLFFDNDTLYNFLYRLAAKGIRTPVLAGVMPVTSKTQIEKMTKLCGATLTPRLRAMLDRFDHSPEALRQAGIAFATEQIADLLANGVRGVHIYTMNRPDIARSIVRNTSELFVSARRERET
jgi:methylenetetrahydrofolate reductase (NADPH)